MPKKITPKILEEAIEWLGSEIYCCHALTCALSGHPYESLHTEGEHIEQAESFLSPLLERDGISSSGEWTSLARPYKAFPLKRKDWLRKIAQELREGKISAD